MANVRKKLKRESPLQAIRLKRDRLRAISWLYKEAVKAQNVQWAAMELFNAPFGSDKIPSSFVLREAARILNAAIP